MNDRPFCSCQIAHARYNCSQSRTFKFVSKPSKLLQGLAALLLALTSWDAFAAGIAVDASVSANHNTAGKTSVSPVFSTKSTNELLLAFIATDATGSTNTRVLSVTGGGLTWVLAHRANAQPGTSEIWRAFAPAVLHNVNVTATLSATVASSITVSSFSGVATTGSYGSGAIGATSSGYAPSGEPHAKLVTTHNNSLVVGVGTDSEHAIARTLMPGEVLMSQDLSPAGDTYWVQRMAAPIPLKGTTVSLGDTAPTADRFNMSICEILPGTPTLAVSASSLSFGSVADGTTKTLTLTAKSSGTSPVTLSSDTIAGTGFSRTSSTLPATLSPGQSVAFNVDFSPKTAGADSGTLTLNSNSSSGSKTLISLAGTGTAVIGPRLSLSAASLPFGNVVDGSSKSLTLTLSSTGTASVEVKSASITGTGFSLVAGTWPQTLAVGQSLTVSVKFAPTTAAADLGSLTLSSTSSSGATSAVSLTGTGTAAPDPKLGLSTTGLSFGTLTVGSSGDASVTLSSTGTSAVTVSAGSVAGTGFSLVNGSFPMAINPGATATVTVKFAPTAAGSDTGTLTLTSNSTLGTSSVVKLTGTADAATTYSVNLNWNPPASSPAPVAGYHVYRSISGSNAAALLNSTLDVQTAYVDSTVSSGTTYVYDVKSVDAEGIESAASNQTTVTIP